MKFDIITIFPEIFDSYFQESIIKRAQEKKIIEINTHNLRDWTDDKHKTVDDTPYGGGAGMLMKIEPIHRAICDLRPCLPEGRFAICEKSPNRKIVLLSARGKRWTQAMAKEYSKLDQVILLCGRYEGVDERVLEFIDEEISIGDYVLTGGELGAMVIVDSVSRLLPDVLGNNESSVKESHSEPGVLEYPQYTRPEVFEVDGKEYKVPDILLSGNHAEIEKWRQKNSKNIKL